MDSYYNQQPIVHADHADQTLYLPMLYLKVGVNADKIASRGRAARTSDMRALYGFVVVCDPSLLSCGSPSFYRDPRDESV